MLARNNYAGYLMCMKTTRDLDTLRAKWLAAEAADEAAAAAHADACRGCDKMAEKLAKGRAARARSASRKAWRAYESANKAAAAGQGRLAVDSYLGAVS